MRRTQTTGRVTKTKLIQAESTVRQDADHNKPGVVNGSQATTTKKKTNVLAGFLAIWTFVLVLYWKRTVMRPWISEKMHQLDIPGCLAILSAALTVFVWCKDQCTDFYYTQRRHLTYVDDIPGMKQDLAGVKEDLAGVKTDVAEIKVILSGPWYKFRFLQLCPCSST